MHVMCACDVWRGGREGGWRRWGERRRESADSFLGHPYACITVEPLIKDPLNKGHLSIKDTCLSPIPILWCIILPLNKGHLFIEDTLNDPNVSFIRRFHCI